MRDIYRLPGLREAEAIRPESMLPLISEHREIQARSEVL
ncbi:hypothetical protein SZ54_5045 [Rhizobium sp. UR51a]|nr:hypothetical protein SZ54_5045 [Rhizobium sp. UR51a]